MTDFDKPGYLGASLWYWIKYFMMATEGGNHGLADGNKTGFNEEWERQKK